MKRFGRIAVCLAGGMALNAGLRAASPASANNPLPDNPYATVAVRNIFGLNPPAAAIDTNALLVASLPKITPTGIMSVFGYSQVLFKVAAAAAKAGQPAKEEFYILSQGQRQDDIEVTKIDEKKSLVTFNNHGFTQELPLANAPASGGAPASSSPGPGNPGMVPRPPGGGGNNGPGGFTQFGAGSGGNNGGMGNNAPGSNGNAGNGANGGMNFGGSTQGRTYQPEASTMTPGQTIDMIEVQRLKYLAEGNPMSKLLPPTQHTQETIDMVNGGGGNQPPQSQ